MEPAVVGAVIASLGIGAAIAAAITAVSQRRKVGADATAVVTEAARELIDPLRKELATVRTEQAAAIEAERKQTAALHTELTMARDEARGLRAELAATRRELDACYAECEEHKRRLRDLDR